MSTPEPIAPLTAEELDAIRGRDQRARVPAATWAVEDRRRLLATLDAERADAHPPATVPDEGLRESLRLAFEKAELDWPSRPDLAYAGLRTFIRAVLSSTDDEVGEPDR